MAVEALPNQRSSESVGTWMWREGVVLSTVTATDDVIFELEDNVMILDLVVVVTTAGTATTSLTGTPQIANTGGDVAMEGAIDLEAAAVTLWDRATGAGTITNKSKCPFQILITSDTPLTAATVTVGLFVARINYEPDA